MVETESAIVYCAGVLDGTGGPALLDAAVRMRGERIEAIGPADSIRPQNGEHLTEYDLRHLWVTPGLIDEHTHLGLAGDGRSYEDMALDPDELMILGGVQNLRR